VGAEALPKLKAGLRAHNLTGPWDTSAPQTAPASGLLEFHDWFVPSGRAFYRAVQQ
jgi:hypothetical protein